MLKFILLSLLFTTSCASIAANDDITTLIIIRHAEKETGQDPSLTNQGESRADSLVDILEKYDIEAVYSSTYKRTIETGTPVSEDRQIRIESSIDPLDYESILKDVLAKHKGSSVLVVGHSNTIPGLINYLSPGQNIQEIDESDFSQMFIVKYSEAQCTVDAQKY